MDELIKTFHIDYKLLLAQIINFSVVVFVLYRFAYKPLLKTMNERTSAIKKGLDDAKEAQQQLEKAEQAREKRIVAAKKEAKIILEEAQKMAEKNKEEMVGKAKEEAQKVVEKAKEQIQSEKDKMLKEVKQEVGSLVVLATEKVVGEKIDQQKDKEIISKTIADF